jgi:uncharacterized protein (TIGR04255 family)
MPEPVLRKAPLTSVVCELRFQEAAADLQLLELSRGVGELGLPAYELEEGMQLALGPGQLGQQNVKRHRFATPDGSATFTLAEDLFSYEESTYLGIDTFLERWEPLASLVAEQLGITARTRLGLRYINQVPLDGDDRSSVAAAVTGDLLPPWGSDPAMEDLTVSLHELRFKQAEGEITFRHGLQRLPRGAIYLLDFDHYEQRLAPLDVAEEVARLRAFNQRVEGIFRWSITEEKYKSFEPEERGGG